MSAVGNSFLLLIRTLFCYFLAGCVCLVVILPLLCVLLILPASYCHDNRFISWMMNLFYHGIVGALLVPFSVKGKEHMPQEPAIIVANHQSALDIPILGSVLGSKPHVWYAMSYYVQFPVLGFFIRRLGIPVDRNNGSTAARSLRQGVKFAQTHTSNILIFPEGGRYNDGTIHEFLQGFAFLARSTGRPVVPVFMPHNGKVYPPRSFWIYWHPLAVVIGPQFVYHEQDTDEVFIQRVRSWFELQAQV
jgi:1-acyl-sn-glycerol-3-phosphate acyltransferase